MSDDSTSGILAAIGQIDGRVAQLEGTMAQVDGIELRGNRRAKQG